MPYLELDEDHLDELEAVVEDYGVGMEDYAPLEKFLVMESFAGDIPEEELLRFREIVEAALEEDGDYSNSLLNEILSRIDRALEYPVAIEIVEEVDDDDYEDEDDDLAFVAPEFREEYRRLKRLDKEDDDEDDDEDEDLPVRGEPAEQWPPVQFDNPVRNPASRTTVSIWLDKDRFRTVTDARKWLKKRKYARFQTSNYYSSDGFWAFPQMSRAKERKYKGKILSKYISDGVLLKFVPSRLLNRS